VLRGGEARSRAAAVRVLLTRPFGMVSSIRRSIGRGSLCPVEIATRAALRYRAALGSVVVGRVEYGKSCCRKLGFSSGEGVEV
jgi:hypothetical protein